MNFATNISSNSSICGQYDQATNLIASLANLPAVQGTGVSNIGHERDAGNSNGSFGGISSSAIITIEANGNGSENAYGLWANGSFYIFSSCSLFATQYHCSDLVRAICATFLPRILPRAISFGGRGIEMEEDSFPNCSYFTIKSSKSFLPPRSFIQLTFVASSIQPLSHQQSFDLHPTLLFHQPGQEVSGRFLFWSWGCFPRKSIGWLTSTESPSIPVWCVLQSLAPCLSQSSV